MIRAPQRARCLDAAPSRRGDGGGGTRWRRTGQLPFPRLPASRIKELAGRLSYPPPGSPDFNATEEDLAEAGGEHLSAEDRPKEGPAEERQTFRPATERS